MSPLEFTSPEILASEAQLLRSVTSAGLLFVEGHTDLTFWRSRVRTQTELVDTEGKHNLLGAIDILDGEGFVGALGVVDDDRDSLQGITPPSPNLVVTDTADLECLLLRSPAWHRLVAEFADRDKVKAFEREHGELRDALLDRGLIFGRLRWALRRAEQGTGQLEKPTRFIDRTRWVVDRDALYAAAVEATPLSLDALTAHVAALPPADPWRVCRGHDLIKLLLIGLQHVFGPAPGIRNISERALMQVLRSGFDDASLHATRMWADMCAWEDRHPHYRMLRR